jgi:NTE family protein
MTNPRRQIIFALGGGGARTAAIAGAASVLFEEGIRPDYIVGSSMGFVVGGLMGAGLHPEEICRYFESGKIMSAFLPVPPYVRLASMPWTMIRHFLGIDDYYDGLYNGRKLQKFLNAAVPGGRHRIEEWNIPVAAVAFNLLTGRSEIIDRGEFGLVAAATTAVPALFRPVQIDGGLYLDGGVFDNLPVRIAKDIAQGMGGGIVIAINVNEPDDEEVPVEHFRKIGNATFRVMNAHYRLTDMPQEALADVVIRAKLPIRLTSKSKHDINIAITSGEQAAKAALPKIRAALAGDRRQLSDPVRSI